MSANQSNIRHRFKILRSLTVMDKGIENIEETLKEIQELSRLFEEILAETDEITTNLLTETKTMINQSQPKNIKSKWKINRN